LKVEPLKLTPSVYWVGVNDANTKRFEGLWSIPEGVSLNSYLVLGTEKAALIDSVLSRFEEEHLTKISQVVNLSKVEYIILNHMEPDHTEAVSGVLEALPRAKVILTPMALSMLKAFYHVDPQTMIVKGDDVVVDLGGRTVRFIQTPFLHWPETMCTYLVEERILFSCDLFGSFGRLPEDAIMETRIKDIEQFICSASKEYFAGVFTRHRDYILRAIEKFATLGIEIEVLAPSHGPVYTTSIKHVMDLWASWSRPDYTRKVLVVVGSMYGMTLKFLDAILEGIEEACGEPVVRNLVEDSPQKSLEAVINSPALIIGSPTYEYDLFPPLSYFLDLLETKKITDRFVGVFGGFAWAGGGMKKLTERLNALGFKMIGTPVETRGTPTQEDLERAKAMAKKVVEAAFKEYGI